MQLIDLEPGPPNLDGMFPEDLDRFHRWTIYRKATLSLTLFPGEPQGFRKKMIDLLGEYAAAKSNAMKLRASGSIQAALSYERLCDNIYSRLPEKARW